VSLEPRPLPGADVRALREAARDQAKGVSSALVIAVAMVLALTAVAAFVVLDYRFGQASHRLVKVLIAVSLFGVILVWPKIGLYVFPLLLPFLLWFPKIPIPGVNALNGILASVYFTWALSRMLRREPIFRGGRVGWVLAAVLGIAALSVVRGGAFPTGYYYDTSGSALSLFRCGVTFLTYFIALAMVRGERDRKILSWMVVIGLLAEALVTVRFGRSGRGGRAVGSIGQANELGAFLAMYSVLAAALFFGTRNLLARGLLAGTVLAGAYANILSLSRGSILAMGTGLLYVTFRRSRMLGVLLVLVIAASPLWAPDYLKDRMTSTQTEVDGSDEMQLENSSQLRIDTWKAIIRLVSDHPIDGVGFAGLEYVLPETGEELGIEVKDSAHNTYLRFLGEMGIFGLGFFCLLLWKCWRLGEDAARVATRPFDRQLAIGLAGATITMAVSCAFGDRFFSIVIAGGFWLVCALVDDILSERAGAPA